MIRSQQVTKPMRNVQSVSPVAFGSLHPRWTLAALLFVTIRLLPPAWALNPVLSATAEVTPGLHLLAYAITEPGTKAAYVLRLDLARPELTLRVGFAHGTVKGSREPATEIAKRYQAPGCEVVAAVNASFFEKDGTPVGAVMDGGSLLTTFRGWNRATFGWTGSHRPLSRVDLSDATSEVVFPDGTALPVNDINDAHGPEELVLYTPEYDAATGAAAEATEYTVRGVNYPLSPKKVVSGTVTAAAAGTGRAPIPGDGFVLSASGTAAAAMVKHATIGDRLRVRIGFSDPIWNAAEALITGAGWIVRDGTPPTELWQRYPEGFRALHPRTLVGWNHEYLYLVAVDGRQPGHSDGMTFPQMAEFMKDTLGCREAVNFDGGGSTTMVVAGRVINRPSDGQERPIPTALLVVSDPAPSALPIHDRFLPSGRKPFWRDRFTVNPTEKFDPPAPGGDGTVLRVDNPDGGLETVRVGKMTDRDYSVSAWLYCRYRPELASTGFDRVALFARDAGDGAFDSPEAGSSNCYALMWDSDNGRLHAGSYRDGKWFEFLDEAKSMPGSAWRHFRIDCRGDRIGWFVNGAPMAEVNDSSHSSGLCGVAYREEFSDDQAIGAALVEDFIMGPVPAQPASR